jgi:hypothetical protein
MAKPADVNFVRQQGFRAADASTCAPQYSALMFQPRVLGVLVLAGLITQAWLLFLILSAVLWWNVAVPAWNPFDLFYNHLVAAPAGRPRLTPAPGPRRFAQGMAATFMLATGLFLLRGWLIAAFVVEALLVVALGALIFGKFCLGSYIFHRLRGDAAYARRTLPWARHD